MGISRILVWTDQDMIVPTFLSAGVPHHPGDVIIDIPSDMSDFRGRSYQPMYVVDDVCIYDQDEDSKLPV